MTLKTFNIEIMDSVFLRKLFEANQRCPACPSAHDVSAFFADLLGGLFAEFALQTFPDLKKFEQHMVKLERRLADLLAYQKTDQLALTTSKNFFDDLPRLHALLHEDVVAMYEGDPAAKSVSEVIRSYPGFYAIAAYRLANALAGLGVSEIPRMITEHAHSKTGIDIHPGATIGRAFCIDHGTGIVIGETAVIGNHVKIYQGVTLGALSVSKADAQKKRHPTLEDHVVVYAGATILGGETVVGRHSIIGGNVWLTRSVSPHSKVYYQSKMSNGTKDQIDTIIFKGDHS